MQPAGQQSAAESLFAKAVGLGWEPSGHPRPRAAHVTCVGDTEGLGKDGSNIKVRGNGGPLNKYGQVTAHALRKKEKFGRYFIPYTKTNPRCTNDLQVKGNIVHTCDENTGELHMVQG